MQVAHGLAVSGFVNTVSKNEEKLWLICARACRSVLAQRVGWGRGAWRGAAKNCEALVTA